MIFEMVEIIKDDIMIHQSGETVISWESSNIYHARVNKLSTCYEIEYPFLDSNMINIFIDEIKELRNKPIIIENCIVEYPRNYRAFVKGMREHMMIKYVNCVFLNDDARNINKNIYVNCYSYQVRY